MKLLLTGANGLLGQKIVAQSLEDVNIELLATSLGENRNDPALNGYAYQSMDITDRAACLNVCSDFQPDVIIHTAAMTQVDSCELDHEACDRINVEAMHYLTEAAQQSGAYLVHLSTDFIFDGEAGPYRESDQPNPLSYYGESKWRSEQIVQDSDVPFSIARTVLVYGVAHAMSRSNIVLWVKKSLEEGKPIRVVTDQFRSPTLAEDLAAGCLILAHQRPRGVFHISGPEILTPYAMALQTAAQFQLDASLISKANSSNFSQPARRPPRTGFIIDKMRSLGYQPRTFSQGLEVVANQLAQ